MTQPNQSTPTKRRGRGKAILIGSAAHRQYEDRQYHDTDKRRAVRQAHYDIYCRAITTYVKRFWLQHGYGPDIREIQEGCGVSSTSVVKYRLERMRDKGDMLFEDGQARTIRLPSMVISFKSPTITVMDSTVGGGAANDA